jgi:hypothetical protein
MKLMNNLNFNYVDSYLNYYDFCLNCNLFANSLARILKKYFEQDELRLGFIGYDPGILPLAYGFNEHGYVVNGFFAGDSTPLHQYQPIEFLNPDVFDVIFFSESVKNWHSLEDIAQNSRIKFIPLSQLVNCHLQILMSLDRASFISCLDPRKLSVISLCNALSPKGGVFLECGVYMGGTTIYVTQQSDSLKLKREIFALDTFEGMPAPVEKDGNTPFQEGLFSDNQLETVKSHYNSHNVLERINIHKGLIQDTLPTLGLKARISLAFLDVDQYSGTRAALDHVIPHLHQNGLIVVDDADGMGVDLAIKETLAEHQNVCRIQIIRGFDVLYNGESFNQFTIFNNLA